MRKESKENRMRFSFGKNWKKFLQTIDEERIQAAEESLKEMLGVTEFTGKSFLDVGSGSGLFSLAAMRERAQRVHSFDYDEESVACARELKSRFFPDDPRWTIERGDALDKKYIQSLGAWDVVYSWGVLHHTGAMRDAIENIMPMVNDGGKLYIAIYNHQRYWSSIHTMVKRTYNAIPGPGKFIMAGLYLNYQTSKWLLRDILFIQNPLKRYREKKKKRGMSTWHDIIDWLGGYPFEVAKPEEIFEICQRNGFRLEKLKTCGGGLGNNEFVFIKESNK